VGLGGEACEPGLDERAALGGVGLRGIERELGEGPAEGRELLVADGADGDVYELRIVPEHEQDLLRLVEIGDEQAVPEKERGGLGVRGREAAGGDGGLAARGIGIEEEALGGARGLLEFCAADVGRSAGVGDPTQGGGVVGCEGGGFGIGGDSRGEGADERPLALEDLENGVGGFGGADATFERREARNEGGDGPGVGKIGAIEGDDHRMLGAAGGVGGGPQAREDEVLGVAKEDGGGVAGEPLVGGGDGPGDARQEAHGLLFALGLFAGDPGAGVEVVLDGVVDQAEDDPVARRRPAHGGRVGVARVGARGDVINPSRMLAEGDETDGRLTAGDALEPGCDGLGGHEGVLASSGRDVLVLEPFVEAAGRRRLDADGDPVGLAGSIGRIQDGRGRAVPADHTYIR
jgi:hypothetical protein